MGAIVFGLTQIGAERCSLLTIVVLQSFDFVEESLLLLVYFLVFSHHEVVEVRDDIQSLGLLVLDLSGHFRRLLIATSDKLLLFDVTIFILIQYHLLVLFLFILLLGAVIAVCLQLPFRTLYLKRHT